MLRELTTWSKEQDREVQTAEIEYRRTDFYGPFVTAKIQKNGSVKIWPEKTKIETAEVSTTDLKLLSAMADECFEEYGEFILILPLFEVLINGKKPAEELITEKLMQIRLF